MTEQPPEGTIVGHTEPSEESVINLMDFISGCTNFLPCTTKGDIIEERKKWGNAEHCRGHRVLTTYNFKVYPKQHYCLECGCQEDGNDPPPRCCCLLQDTFHQSKTLSMNHIYNVFWCHLRDYYMMMITLAYYPVI